ncbi:hypothetical protein CYLTODRAFT_382829 [Cylindrobasidium torrendii FP15055 ss-10]|uniref:Zn(2)-C6 fungal-type domain-containing protein n=1 Tax=Cylindrobasidium torrendii FP15055 ss-10 TaxID=1314674 RepID=A0A0D7AYT7_9AGAR|nr:hypothetical protein CYLTODRAFT_382829 [Cylindrobasidium torrendii FP15055 ss-10]
MATPSPEASPNGKKASDPQTPAPAVAAAAAAPPYPYMSPPHFSYPPNYASPPPPPGSYPPLPPGYPPYAYQPYPYQLGQAPVLMYQQPAPPASSSGSEQGTKRKRKDKSDDQDDDGGRLRPASSSTSVMPVDAKKRTKTARACDSCRSRKIRCDILTDIEPIVCQHCKQYGFECTYFLPIAETRFKKKKWADEEHTDSSSNVQPINPIAAAMPVHPPRAYEMFDLRQAHQFEVFSPSPTSPILHVRKSSTDPNGAPAPPLPKDMQIDSQLIQNLLNSYFTEVAPLLPIVTPQELLAIRLPPPILLYSMCIVAATQRHVPQTLFDQLRYILNALIRADDVLSTASIVNVQSLLILCMSADCHSQFVPNALSSLWVRLGTAIRMAQDLGLHRAESVGTQDIELRRRLWAVCVITDRWISLTYGNPSMIDVGDCDARLPGGGDVTDVYMDELVRLSLLLGLVLKTIYSPTGLTFVQDDILEKLISDIEDWKARLPDSLTYRGVNSPLRAGVLHLLYTCACMTFWRVFMRLSYSCPAHLKFTLSAERWTGLVVLAGEAIDWLDANEGTYDSWLLVSYGATSCALVQYHTWARRRTPEARVQLAKLKDCVRRWESRLSPDHMSTRRKTSEIIGLLSEATTADDQGQTPMPTGAPGGIEYKRDPTHPQGGVFVSTDGAEVDTSTATNSILEMSSFVTPGTLNLNPGMNMVSKDPQVTNTLDFGDLGLMDQLDGLPGGMFDWGQWESFFAKLNGGGMPVVPDVSKQL